MNERLLLVGIGNPGRQDDGLGPALTEAVERLGIPDLDIDANYQLNIEDAAAVAERVLVVFVDADVSGPEPFGFRRVVPEPGPSFTSHAQPPGKIVALAQDAFGRAADCWALGIRGYEFELAEGLSEKASQNLAQALAFIEPVLRSRQFVQHPEVWPAERSKAPPTGRDVVKDASDVRMCR